MELNNNSQKIASARNLAEDILSWAKQKNLFAKVPLEDAVDQVEKSRFNEGLDKSFKSQATEEVLRKKSPLI